MKLQHKGRGVTLATLVLALGAAVYMNWNFAKSAPQAVSTESEAAAVSAQADTTAVYDPLTDELPAEETANKNYGEAQLVSASQDTGTEFFDTARMARTKARDEALDSIQKTLKNTSLSEEEKDLIYLHVFEERSFDDMSRITGLTPDRCKNIYYYAIRKIRKRMGAKRDEF